VIGISILQSKELTLGEKSLKHCKWMNRNPTNILPPRLCTRKWVSFILKDGYLVALKPGERSEKWQKA
jgi:hypothetical protein